MPVVFATRTAMKHSEHAIIEASHVLPTIVIVASWALLGFGNHPGAPFGTFEAVSQPLRRDSPDLHAALGRVHFTKESHLLIGSAPWLCPGAVVALSMQFPRNIFHAALNRSTKQYRQRHWKPRTKLPRSDRYWKQCCPYASEPTVDARARPCLCARLRKAAGTFANPGHIQPLF